ncbi:MFS transporter [Dissulfuribacter thermophilus]|uniref:MFS transporter n=1 Tax=Dissulfuribacter thermophilus TaxID=1156395 RepID=UPI0011467C2F|nr:MFS transporter [Dissulfuribacter thermophilus]
MEGNKNWQMGCPVSTYAKAVAALKHPGFRWLLIGQALSLQGNWIQNTAQRWLVLELSNSPFYVGLLGAVSGIPVLLFSFMGGYLSDRFDRFSVLFLAHVLILLQGLFLGVMVDIDRITLGLLLITSFFFGTGMAFEVPARQTLVFDLVGKKDITNALALHSTAFNLARFLGPAVAGFLMDLKMLSLCFYLKAVSALLVIWALFIILKRGYATNKKAVKQQVGLKEGIKFASRHPLIRPVLTIILVFGITLLPYSILLPSLGRDVLGLGAREYGLLCSSNGLGALAGAIFVAFLGNTDNRTKWWWIGSTIFPVTLIIVGLAQSFYQASFALFFSGFFMVICATSAISLIQIHSKDHIRGQMMGLFTTSFMGFFPIGSILVGAVGDLLGVRATLILQGSTALLIVIMIKMRHRLTTLFFSSP